MTSATLICALAQRPEVVFAYLFGSQASGTAGSRSDVDVAVYLRPGVDPFDARLDLMGVVEKALGSEAFDLVVLNTAPLSLAGRVLATRVVLVDNDPPVRHEYESLTARMFSDFRIREQRLLEAVAARG